MVFRHSTLLGPENDGAHVPRSSLFPPARPRTHFHSPEPTLRARTLLTLSPPRSASPGNLLPAATHHAPGKSRGGAGEGRQGKKADARAPEQGRGGISSIPQAGRKRQRRGTKVWVNNRVWEKAGSTNCRARALRERRLRRHPDWLFLTGQKSGPQASTSSKPWTESLCPASLGIFGGPVPLPRD